MRKLTFTDLTSNQLITPEAVRNRIISVAEECGVDLQFAAYCYELAFDESEPIDEEFFEDMANVKITETM